MRKSSSSEAAVDQADYYDEDYFEWQKSKGVFGGIAELIKFQPHITNRDNVVDFGCGGGFLLANLTCQSKIGVEINPSARASCAQLNVQAVDAVERLPDDWADVIISNHALEHVTDPLSVLKQLRPKLKSGGKVIFVVPCEGINTKYKAGNVDQHLFTWSPVNLGNLFEAAGYRVIECKAFLHRWMPKGGYVQPVVGWQLFHLGSWVYGFLFRRLSQVRVIATV